MLKLRNATLPLALVSALVVGVLAGGAPAGASAAVASTDLTITRVGTDAMGGDNFANRNREFVTIKNTSTGPLDVNGVVIEDNWARGNNSGSGCNTYKIADLPDNTTTVLAPNEYVTVFNGGGSNYKNGAEYRLFANSNVDCGYQGHFLNNDSDKVWVTRGVDTWSKDWDWNGGYYIVTQTP